MKQEDKELLLKDLCARVPYGIKFKANNEEYIREIHYIKDEDAYIREYRNLSYWICTIKPYLRPMSSMTEEEKREFQSFYPGCFGSQWLDVEKGEIEIFECSSTLKLYLNNSVEIVDWLNAHHFDYRGLIKKGLALEAPKDMYK